MGTHRLDRSLTVILLVAALLCLWGAAAARAGTPAAEAPTAETPAASEAPAAPGPVTFTPAAESIRALSAVKQAQLTSTDGGVDDEFGLSVAIDADTAVVGSPRADVEGRAGQGAVYVFVRTAGAWSLQAKLTASDGAAGDQLGRAVAISGDRVVASAAYAYIGATVQQGAAYVFTRSGAAWTQSAKLTASDGADYDFFGIQSVAISGGTVVVGCMHGDVTGQFHDDGAAYVFVRVLLPTARWVQQAKLVAADPGVGAHFGNSVAIDGDTAVVGALEASGGGHSGGAAYVFTRSGTSWTQQAKLLASDGATMDMFGSAVALSGGTAAIGACTDTVGGLANRGSVYIFTRTGNLWSQRAKLTVSDGAEGDRFGLSVALAGTALVAGAPFDDGRGGADQGSAYLFTGSGATWTRQAKTTGTAADAGDQFGESASVSGYTAVVGAVHDDVGANADQGSAQVYLLMEKPGPPIAQSPKGRIVNRRPTFLWTRAIRATSYEVYVYKGKNLLVKHAGIAVPATSWRTLTRLPRGVSLSWKVRARNAAGTGPWSNSQRFVVK